MDQSAIAVRYAKAFFLTAKEKNLLESFKEDINLILELTVNSKDFILLLESPVVKTSKKIALISSIFKGKLNEITLSFLLLIAKNKREVNIPGICRNFLALTRKDQNIKSATLITASEISNGTVNKIKVLIEKELDAKVELSSQIDSDLIGGMVLRIDDIQYDASVSTQLKKVKQELLDSELK